MQILRSPNFYNHVWFIIYNMYTYDCFLVHGTHAHGRMGNGKVFISLVSRRINICEHIT